MPYLRVRIATPETTVTAQQVAQQLTGLAVTELKKDESAVAVDVRFTDPANWFVGGQPLTATGATSFYVEIKITAATNTRDQKAAFVRETFTSFQTLFGHLAPTSYVVLHDVAGDAWGYGGQTQEYRYIKG